MLKFDSSALEMVVRCDVSSPLALLSLAWGVDVFCGPWISMSTNTSDRSESRDVSVRSVAPSVAEGGVTEWLRL